MSLVQKITPFFWFDKNAEEAVNHYVSIFKNSRIKQVLRWGKAGPGPEGSVLTIAFELEGQPFTALNGGSPSRYTQSLSLVVHCENQEEVDHYWEKLSEGGEPGQCSWLKDRFGVSWQIVPKQLLELLHDPDPEKASRVLQAMMQMQKIDIAELERA